MLLPKFLRVKGDVIPGRSEIAGQANQAAATDVDGHAVVDKNPDVQSCTHCGYAEGVGVDGKCPACGGERGVSPFNFQAYNDAVERLHDATFIAQRDASDSMLDSYITSLNASADEQRPGIFQLIQNHMQINYDYTPSSASDAQRYIEETLSKKIAAAKKEIPELKDSIAAMTRGYNLQSDREHAFCPECSYANNSASIDCRLCGKQLRVDDALPEPGLGEKIQDAAHRLGAAIQHLLDGK